MKKKIIFGLVILLLSYCTFAAIVTENSITVDSITGQIDVAYLSATGVDNITNYIEENAFLGEIRIIDVSTTNATTIADMRSYGWAVADGTTPSAQGISGANITSTPNLVDKFIRGDASTSGTTGGSETHTHNIEIAELGGDDIFSDGGSTTRYYLSSANHLPPYYEMVYMIKVKIV